MTDDSLDSSHPHDIACDVAHGLVSASAGDRRLITIFDSPVSRALTHFAVHVGFEVTTVEPQSAKQSAQQSGANHVVDFPSARSDENADVVVTDHDRAELGDLLADALRGKVRWIGVMGSPRHTAPHIQALRDRGFSDDQIARVHRPIGLDIGSHSPEEIAISTIAGLLADRNGRTGGQQG